MFVSSPHHTTILLQEINVLTHQPGGIHEQTMTGTLASLVPDFQPSGPSGERKVWRILFCAADYEMKGLQGGTSRSHQQFTPFPNRFHLDEAFYRACPPSAIPCKYAQTTLAGINLQSNQRFSADDMLGV